MKHFALIWAIAVLGWIISDPAQGQDTQYWTEQYGARSMLLSGSVIGSVDDMSAVFYNPGALGYLQKPELLLSASAYQVRSLNVKDSTGREIDLGGSQVNLIPNLIAGSFRFNFHGTNKLAYSLLTRYRFDAEFQGSGLGGADFLPPLSGVETAAGGLDSLTKLKDVWVGLTWARALGDHLGVGVTTFCSIRNQEGRDEFFAQARTQTGDMALIYGLDQYEAHTYGVLFKAGLGLNLQPFTAGLTVTTPSLHIAGSGSSTINETWIGVTPDDGFVTDIQEDVRANHESPLSVGLGVAWRFRQSKIHLSAEWFAAVEGYDVLELVPFTSQDTGEVVNRTIRDKADEVFNFGVGIEHGFSEKFSGFLGFNTDNSSYSPGSDVAATQYDLVHLAGGGKMKFKKVRLTLGARYAWGDQVIGKDEGSMAETIANTPGLLREGTVDFKQLTIILGFALDI